jgi:hypothetical protein
MSSEPKFSVTKVDELPERVLLKAREQVYDDVLSSVMEKDKGIYKIDIPGKTAKTAYSALTKRIKDQPLKIHMRQREGKSFLFLEKTELESSSSFFLALFIQGRGRIHRNSKSGLFGLVLKQILLDTFEKSARAL